MLVASRFHLDAVMAKHVREVKLLAQFLEVDPSAHNQYSSGNRIVVTLRSHSVMIQKRIFCFDSKTESRRVPLTSARSFASLSPVSKSPQSPLAWRPSAN